jgi:A/G-specific adenine glycosylase
MPETPFDPELADADERDRFRALVLENYAQGARSFPWRETRDPWAILVSEVMLQQTQTERVLPKYLAWMERYPIPAALASAPLDEALALWSGLGYNRRALALVRAAQEIARLPGGFPSTEEALLALPGVGSYTARAVLAFAFDIPSILIETNIRAVFLHHFFRDGDAVPDSRIAPLVEATLDREDPRTWYYALMDYGSRLKRSLKAAANPGRRSAHYARQSPFADSNRRLRGAILKALAVGVGAGPRRATRDQLAAILPFSRERLDRAAAELVAEGFLAAEGSTLRLRSEAD